MRQRNHSHPILNIFSHIHRMCLIVMTTEVHDDYPVMFNWILISYLVERENYWNYLVEGI